MSHEEFDNLSPLYALGALDGDELVRFEAHLGGCGNCGKLVREYSEVSTGLAYSLPPVRPAAALKERILQQVRPASRPSRRLEFAAAAAMILAAVTGILWWSASRQIEDLRSEVDRQKRDLVRFQDERNDNLNTMGALRKDIEGLQKDVAAKEKELGTNKDELARLKKDIKSKEDALALRSEVERILGHNQSTASPMKGTDVAKTATGRVVRLDRDIAVVAYGLAPLKEKKAYVLWIFEGATPVAVGDYQVDAKGTLVATYTLPKDFKGTAFALSIEDDDNDYPAPTMSDVVLLPAQ